MASCQRASVRPGSLTTEMRFAAQGLNRMSNTLSFLSGSPAEESARENASYRDRRLVFQGGARTRSLSKLDRRNRLRAGHWEWLNRVFLATTNLACAGLYDSVLDAIAALPRA